MRNHRLFAVIAGSVLLVVLTACGASSRFKEKSNVVISDTSVHQVELSVDVIESRKIRVTFENKSDKTYVYGKTYSLEYYSNGNWYKVPFNKDAGIFTHEGILLGPAEEFASKDPDKFICDPTGCLDVTLDGMGVLPQGHYRIIKGLSLLEDEGPARVDYHLAAEFDLE